MLQNGNQRKNWRYRVAILFALVMALGLSVSVALAGLPTSAPTGQQASAPNTQAKPPQQQAGAPGVTARDPNTRPVSPPPAIPPAANPAVVLYDQYNNDGGNAIISQVRTDSPTLSADTADDFVVPAGQTWQINQVDVRSYPGLPAQTSFNVNFYADAGTVPGAAVYTANNLAYSGTNPDYIIPLTTPANLAAGNYWVSIVANMSGANWYWGMRSVQTGDPAAWREGGGFGTGCNAPAWFNRGTCTGTTAIPDQMFRLNGNIAGGATATSTVFASATATACVGAATTYNSTDVPKTFGANPQTVTSILTISGGTTSISDLDLVGLNINHTYIQDIRAELTSPGGTTVVLFNGICGSQDNISNITLDDEAPTAIGSTCPPAAGASYRPTNPLSAFDGQTANGTWTLTLTDTFPGADDGTLTAWGLRVSGGCATATRTSTVAATATATVCPSGNAVINGSLDASDPDFTRPNTFLQGGTCSTDGVRDYDVYTLQTSGGTVTASTCGGAGWDTFLALYQSPNGAPIPGFVPNGCGAAIAANDDACGLQSTVTANLVAGTYYLVVTAFGAPGGAYTVTVTAPGACVTTTPTTTRTNTAGVATATPTCVPTGGNYRIMLAFADVDPTMLRSQIMAEPGVISADYFDTRAGTPTLAQMQAYDIVVAETNFAPADPVILGNNLAAYHDGGGIVIVQFGAFYGPPFSIEGAWRTGNYSPYVYAQNIDGTFVTLGTHDPTHPLMQGVTVLEARNRVPNPLAAGATQVAAYSDGDSAVAYKATNGRTAIGMTAHLSDSAAANADSAAANGSVSITKSGADVASIPNGQYGRIIVNAGRWLKPAVPCATVTATTTRTNTVMATATRTSTSGATATCVPGGGGTPGTWTVVAPLTTLRSRLGVAYVSATGKFYAAGGESTGGNRAIPIEEYDPVANTWTPRAQLNPGVSNTGAVGVGPYVYIPGGWIGTSSVTNMQRFDPVANTITQMAPLPAGATGVAVAAQGNRVYVLGGSTAGGAGTTNYIYDIGTNTWSTGAPVPTAVEYAAAASDGTYLYLIGGNTTNLNIVQRYDPAANIWTAAPTLLQGRGGPGAFFDGQRIWVVGGGWTTYLTSTEYYIPGSAGWVAGPALNTGVRTVGAAYGNSMAIKAGGWNGAYSAVAEKLPFSGGGNCPTASVTNTVVATATRTATSNATATCVPQAAGWTAGPNHPASPGIVRSVGVYFPANGRFYTMGGRTSDTAGSDLTTPYEYNPSTNAWVQKAATFPDNQVNNMACGVLTDAGTPYIYCVGGSAAGATTATARVFRYNPATDVISAVAAPWPGNPGGDTLPGGFAVTGNKLYIVGGFKISVNMTSETWEFTPGTNAWVAKANYPVARGYVPTTAIGSMLYTAGGSEWDGTTLIDSSNSYRFDTATNVWTPITNTPRATGETRAVTLAGEMWVLGGGRVAPNPSNQVEIYNPGTNAWRAGPAFITARRNFAADTDGSRIFIAGGYAPTTATNTMEIYRPAIPCGSPTPTTVASATNTAVPPTSTRTNTAIVPTNTNTAVVPPTNTNTAVPTNTNTAVPPTSTATRPPVATATVCVMPFTDVDIYNPFYIYIKCLYCRGIISGYADNTFRPYNDITRGQTAKIVSNSAGFSEPVSGQRYTDVPTTHTFYVWIMRLTNRNIATGYNTLAECPTGVPCFRPENPVTRGQLAKMASNAAGFSDVPPAGTLTFTDVPPGSTFYLFIERLARRGIINGYPCGVDPNEPCDAQRRPYYRPNHNITRGQASKIVANTFFPVNCTPGTPAILPGR